MLDRYLHAPLVAAVAPAAGRLPGVPAMAVAGTALGLDLAAALAIGHRYYLPGLGLLVVAAAADIAASALEGPAPSQDRLDGLMTLLGTAVIPFAFALALPDRALAAMFLLLGLVVRAGTEGTNPAGDPLVGKTEFLIAFGLACILPNWFSVIAYAVGILCFAGAGLRAATFWTART